MHILTASLLTGIWIATENINSKQVWSITRCMSSSCYAKPTKAKLQKTSNTVNSTFQSSNCQKPAM